VVRSKRVVGLLVVLALAPSSYRADADEAAALSISRHIRQSHTPFGLLLDAIYTAPGSGQLIGYLGYGDAALWTGVYVAAEAHRFAVTRSPEALANARRSLEALDTLSRISGDGLLARYFYPVNDPHVGFFLENRAGTEFRRRTLDGQEYYYATRTTRDQFAGVFFGLGATYDLIDDPGVREACKTIASRLVGYLLDHDWHIYNTDGRRHETFIHRPEQRLSILQVAAHVNPERFAAEYHRHRSTYARLVWLGVLIDVFNDSAYYKFNLDHLYFYNLLRLEPKGSVAHEQYTKAYRRMREAVIDHQNPHFNMIDRALMGPEKRRDAESVALLEQMPGRGLRHKAVDTTKRYKACGRNRACDPVPVAARVYTDFLWQRDPFALADRGDERIEHSGLDYVLPYWMARHYGVIKE
jgi:hypothetical protein